MRSRLAVAVTVLALVFAACGGGKSNKSSSTTSAPGSATTAGGGPSTTTPAALNGLVLTAADFPAGWTRTAADQSTSASDKENNDELATCAGIATTDKDAASIDGDTFNQTQNTEASSEAALRKDNATYTKDAAALKGDKLTPCIKQVFTKVLTKEIGQAPTSIDVTSLSVPSHGDVSVGRRAIVSLNAQGVSLSLYLDFVFLGKAKRELTLTFLNTGKPFDEALERTLIDKVGARLDKV
jgi:hypothetical protein